MIYTAIYKCRRCSKHFTIEVGDNALLLMQVAIHPCDQDASELGPYPTPQEGCRPTGIGDLIGADEEVV